MKNSLHCFPLAGHFFHTHIYIDMTKIDISRNQHLVWPNGLEMTLGSHLDFVLHGYDMVEDLLLIQKTLKMAQILELIEPSKILALEV